MPEAESYLFMTDRLTRDFCCRHLALFNPIQIFLELNWIIEPLWGFLIW